MKTFSTSGTGNQQTLSEIESNNVPIYDSLADVTADLANLSEGQIIATKDTGNELSNPVDAVESGNLHAVTSNAVAEKLGKLVYFKVRNVTKNIGSKTYFTITDFFPDVTNDYIMVAGHGDTPQQNLTIMETTTNGVDTSDSNLICMVGKNTDFTRNTDYTLSFDIFAIKKDLFQERTE